MSKNIEECKFISYVVKDFLSEIDRPYNYDLIMFIEKFLKINFGN